MGVREVVLKNGAAGVLARSSGGLVRPRLDSATAVVDSTGAGDSFNAGYIAARLAGSDVDAAVQAAHRLATAVIGHHGAIIPRAAMP
jgi:2-dehydro-3-deoxygluconokinase